MWFLQIVGSWLYLESSLLPYFLQDVIFTKLNTSRLHYISWDFFFAMYSNSLDVICPQNSLFYLFLSCMLNLTDNVLPSVVVFLVIMTSLNLNGQHITVLCQYQKVYFVSTKTPIFNYLVLTWRKSLRYHLRPYFFNSMIFSRFLLSLQWLTFFLQARRKNCMSMSWKMLNYLLILVIWTFCIACIILLNRRVFVSYVYVMFQHVKKFILRNFTLLMRFTHYLIQ